MSQLRWNEFDLLDYLAVEPAVEDAIGVSHGYTFSRESVDALLTIWQYESFARLTLWYRNPKQELLDVSFFIRGSASVQKHVGTNERYLCFSDCLVAPDRFAYRAMQDPFDKKKYPCGVKIYLKVDPRISCRIAE